MNKDVYKIVYENLDIPKRHNHSIISIFFSVSKSFQCRKIYQRDGLNEAIQYINLLVDKHHKISEQNIELLLYRMRKVMVVHNLLCRVFKRSFNCLETSLSLTTCLVNLGYNVTLVVGKSTNYVNRFFEFHAWVSVEGKPINDTRQVLEMYVPVFERTF